MKIILVILYQPFNKVFLPLNLIIINQSNLNSIEKSELFMGMYLELKFLNLHLEDISN